MRLSSKRLLRNHAAGLVDGVGFAGLAEAAEAHDAAEFFFGIDPQAEDADDLEAVVANRRGDDHRGHAGSRAARFVLDGDDAGERGGDVRRAVEALRRGTRVYSGMSCWPMSSARPEATIRFFLSTTM